MHITPLWGEGRGLQLPRAWGVYPCQGLWWAAGQQGPSPLALIRQETQSKPSYYKYKNSQMHTLYLDPQKL